MFWASLKGLLHWNEIIEDSTDYLELSPGGRDHQGVARPLKGGRRGKCKNKNNSAHIRLGLPSKFRAFLLGVNKGQTGGQFFF